MRTAKFKVGECFYDIFDRPVKIVKVKILKNNIYYQFEGVSKGYHQIDNVRYSNASCSGGGYYENEVKQLKRII